MDRPGLGGTADQIQLARDEQCRAGDLSEPEGGDRCPDTDRPPTPASPSGQPRCPGRTPPASRAPWDHRDAPHTVAARPETSPPPPPGLRPPGSAPSRYPTPPAPSGATQTPRDGPASRPSRPRLHLPATHPPPSPCRTARSQSPGPPHSGTVRRRSERSLRRTSDRSGSPRPARAPLAPLRRSGHAPRASRRPGRPARSTHPIHAGRLGSWQTTHAATRRCRACIAPKAGAARQHQRCDPLTDHLERRPDGHHPAPPDPHHHHPLLSVPNPDRVTSTAEPHPEAWLTERCEAERIAPTAKATG